MYVQEKTSIYLLELGIEPRDSYMLATYCTTELHKTNHSKAAVLSAVSNFHWETWNVFSMDEGTTVWVFCFS
jgi:mevalonate pyrophosphate decarboxylase